MATNQKAQLDLTVNAQGVETGINKAKRSISDLGASAKKAGMDASSGIDQLGKSGETAAQRIDRSTQQIINSIQRTTAETAAGGRGTAAYFEQLAKQRGVDVQAIAPYLQGLNAARTAQDALALSQQRLGNTAKQTAAALRGVPAQITDIFVSLQGGQNPLTVFLQQGGQLRDMFGGIGAAARALASTLASMINPLTVGAAALGSIALAAYRGNQEFSQLQRTLILSGNAAGLTAGQLMATAEAVAQISGGTQGRAAEVLNQVAESGDIAAENLERVTAAAIALERAGGPAAERTVEAFSGLAKEPLKAALKLNESTNFLTRSLYEQIKALEEQGRVVEAANVAQQAYASTIEQRIPALNDSLGFLERAWKGITGAARGAWDAMKDVGRPDSTAEKVANLIDRLAAAQQRLQEAGALPPGRRAQFEQGVKDLQDQLDGLRRTESAARRLANADGERAKQMSVISAFDRDADKYLSKRERMEREITKARNEGAAAGKTQEEIERRIAAIRASYADKGAARTGERISNTEVENYIDSLDRQLEREQKLSEVEKARGEISRRNILSRRDQERIIGTATQIDAAKALEEQAKLDKKAREEQEKAYERATNAARVYIQSLSEENSTLERSNKSAAQHLQELGLTTEELGKLRVARIDATIAEQEALLMGPQVEQMSQQQIDLIAERIRLLREQRSILQQTTGKEIQLESKRTAEEAGKNLNSEVKSALSNAFRDTEGNPLKSFGNALANVVFTRMTESAATALANVLVGTGKDGNNGLFGGILSGIGKLFSADGGGYTGSGARSGGMDGKGGFLAMLHPQETVVDHTKGQRGPGGDTYYVTIDSRADRAQVMSDMQALITRNNGRLIEGMRRREVYS